MPVFYNLILWGFVCFILFTILFRKSIKKGEGTLDRASLGKLNKEQWITIVAMGIMVAMVLGFNIDVGLASFFMAALLSFIGICDEKAALAKVPWGTLMLICGVGVLMNIVNQLGGITLLTTALLSIMTESTSGAIIAGASSLLSFVSSTTGVVMPTMIPTLGGIVTEFGGNVEFVELLSCVMTGSFSAAFSPASTGGGLILAAVASTSGNKISDAEQNKIFGQLFMAGIGVSVLNVFLAWIGLYSFIG